MNNVWSRGLLRLLPSILALVLVSFSWGFSWGFGFCGDRRKERLVN